MNAQAARRHAVSEGFSLVELMVVGTVVFLLLGGVTLVLAQSGKQVWQQAESQIVTVSDAQRALDRMSEDLRNGRQANLACQTAAAGACITPPCLAFDLADGGGRLTYQLSVIGQLLRTVNTGQPQVVASGLSRFTPSCRLNGLVQLEVTAEVTYQQGETTYTLARRPMTSNVFVQNP